MSGKTGSRPTGRKPATVRRQSAKTDGAFGKEGIEQVTGNETERNRDRSVIKRRSGGGAA